jgi:hypothetical protein
MHLLEAALGYAAAGIAVFPCHDVTDGVCSCTKGVGCKRPGKHPRWDRDTLKSGHNSATTQEELVRSWWTRWPNAPIGSPTGRRFVVLDVDARHDGFTSLERLEASHRNLPETLASATGGGGRHYFFAVPAEKTKSNDNVFGPSFPGVDFKGGGGYVILPPSPHQSGTPYSWHGSELTEGNLADVPDWILVVVRADGALSPLENHKPFSVESVWEGISEGERDSSLHRYACSLQARGVQVQEALLLITEAARRCIPPFPEEEAREKVETAYEKYGSAEGEPTAKKRSQAELLIEAAQDVELFRCPDGEPYATVDLKGHQHTMSVRSRAFKEWLRHRGYAASGKSFSAQGVEEATGFLEAKAKFDASSLIHEVHLRVARHQGRIYVDMADDASRTIEIDSKGWRILDRAPVKFRRPRGMRPLPEPVDGGEVARLRDFVNLGSQSEWHLLLAWLVMAFRPEGPYPILVLNGEQGSAKSTTSKVLKRIVDPSAVPLRPIARDDRDFWIGAKNSWVLASDNLSKINDNVSDSLCRLATGGGNATRQLYTDDEESQFEACRPQILNGIDEFVTKDDLISRSLFLNLPRIDERERRSESELWQAFGAALPGILGALLTAVSAALAGYDGVKLNGKPRLADFLQWATAAELALGLNDGAFAQAVRENGITSNGLALESSAFGQAVLRLHGEYGDWSGTCTELLAALEGFASELSRRLPSWPKDATRCSNALKRLAPQLRSRALAVDFVRDYRGRRIDIHAFDANSVMSVMSVMDEPVAHDASGRIHDASDTVHDAGGPHSSLYDAHDAAQPSLSDGGWRSA